MMFGQIGGYHGSTGYNAGKAAGPAHHQNEVLLVRIY